MGVTEVMEVIILIRVLGKKILVFFYLNLIIKRLENRKALKLSQRFTRSLINRLVSTDPQVHSLIMATWLDMIMILKATL